jgi:hypothetical protein
MMLLGRAVRTTLPALVKLLAGAASRSSGEMRGVLRRVCALAALATGLLTAVAPGAESASPT